MATDNGQFKFGFGGRVYMDAAGYFDDETDLGSGSEIRDIRMLMKLNFTNVDLDENSLNGEENFNMIQTRLQFSF